VPEIGRFCVIATTLPFKIYSPWIIVEMLYNCVFWLNSFPHHDGLHATMSLRTIMTALTLYHNLHCKVEYRTYVQVHEKHNNSMEPMTSGAIVLRPSGKEQGEHYFLSLHTGTRILWNNWTELPMPNNVVDAIHQLAEAQTNRRHHIYQQRLKHHNGWWPQRSQHYRQGITYPSGRQ